MRHNQKMVAKAIVAGVSTAAYLLALRYLLPGDQPYFILGIGVVGMVAWFLGTVVGIVVALLLIPLTNLVYGAFTVSTSYMSFASSYAYIAMELLAAGSMGFLRKEMLLISAKEIELAETNERMQTVLAHVQEPGGIYGLCSSCKKILDDAGNWKPLDQFLREKTKMEFSHCICHDCAKEFDSGDEPQT